MKEYICFLGGWIPERIILPFFPAIYLLCFYTPILASSKPSPTKCPFLLMSPKPATVHTALPHLFFASATGPFIPLQPPECHQRPRGPWLPAGEKQTPVWPANGLSPQPKHQPSWRRWPLAALMAAAVQGVCGSQEAGGRTDGWVKDKQWDHSTPHFCQGRG